MIEIEINNEQSTLEYDPGRLKQAVENVLGDRGIESGEISLAVIDDEHMQQLNARYLNHDYPTDVLSFVHEADEHHLEGEIIVSADTATREATRYAWQAVDELLLYVIHGALHLIGHDDHNADDLADMRAAEQRHLSFFGLQPKYDAATTSDASSPNSRQAEEAP